MRPAWEESRTSPLTVEPRGIRTRFPLALLTPLVSLPEKACPACAVRVLMALSRRTLRRVPAGTTTGAGAGAAEAALFDSDERIRRPLPYRGSSSRGGRSGRDGGSVVVRGRGGGLGSWRRGRRRCRLRGGCIRGSRRRSGGGLLLRVRRLLLALVLLVAAEAEQHRQSRDADVPGQAHGESSKKGTGAPYYFLRRFATPGQVDVEGINAPRTLE